jgi:hypothetical protein
MPSNTGITEYERFVCAAFANTGNDMAHVTFK